VGCDIFNCALQVYLRVQWVYLVTYLIYPDDWSNSEYFWTSYACACSSTSRDCGELHECFVPMLTAVNMLMVVVWSGEYKKSWCIKRRYIFVFTHTTHEGTVDNLTENVIAVLVKQRWTSSVTYCFMLVRATADVATGFFKYLASLPRQY
jgi:hypothetical protein